MHPAPNRSCASWNVDGTVVSNTAPAIGNGWSVGAAYWPPAGLAQTETMYVKDDAAIVKF